MVKKMATEAYTKTKTYDRLIPLHIGWRDDDDALSVSLDGVYRKNT